MKKSKIYIYMLILIVSIGIYLMFKDKALIPLIILNGIIIIIFSFSRILKEVFSIEVLFLINYTVYILHIPIKLINENFKVDFYIHAMNRSLAVENLLICGIIASVSFIIGNSIMKEKNNIFDKNMLKNKIAHFMKFIKKYKWFKYVNNYNFSNFIMIIGTILFLIGIHKQGGISYLFSKYIWNSDDSVPIGIMTTGIQVAFMGSVLSFYLFLEKGVKSIWSILKWKGLYIVIFLSLIKLIQGGRIQVLMGFLSLLSIFHFKFRKFKLKEIIVMLVLGYVSLGYIGYFRDYKTLIPNDAAVMIDYMLGGSGGLEYFLNSYTNFTTMHVIDTHNISYMWGTALLDGIIFLIPRKFLPNKEQFLFTTKKLDELNKFETISPVGGLNLAAQNLLNGYILYTIIFMFILGILAYILTEIKNKKKDGVLLYCLLLPFAVISLIRNPIFYTIKEMLQFAIFPYIIFKILRLGASNEKNSF